MLKENGREDRETYAQRNRILAAEPLRTGTVVGVLIAQGPPVPIPNTEVKLCGAENTCLATSRENRSMPTPEASGGESQKC